MTDTVLRAEMDDDLATQSTVLELVWPLTLMSAFFALFAAWFARVLDLNIGAAAWFCACGISGSVLISALIEVPKLRPYRLLAYAGMHPIGVLVLTALWIDCNAGAQPSFMLFFAPPLLASAYLPGLWQRLALYSSTVLAICLAVALCSPSLRWYLSQTGLPVAWLEPLSSQLAPRAQASALSEPPLHALLIMGWGIAALSAMVIIGGAFARRAEMRHRALRTTIASREHQDRLLQAMVRESALLEALVAKSGRIVLSSERFDQLFLDGRSGTDQMLLEVLRPLQPEALQAVLQGTAVHCESALRRADGSTTFVRVEATHFRDVGAELMRLVVSDSTLAEHLVAALDTIKGAIVLIDASDTVLHANALARQLFPACAPKVAAQAALRHADLPVGWWRVAEGAAMPRELRIEGQTHRGYVSCRRSRMNPEPTTVVVLE